jgi:hypothetical protein
VPLLLLKGDPANGESGLGELAEGDAGENGNGFMELMSGEVASTDGDMAKGSSDVGLAGSRGDLGERGDRGDGIGMGLEGGERGEVEGDVVPLGVTGTEVG